MSYFLGHGPPCEGPPLPKTCAGSPVVGVSLLCCVVVWCGVSVRCVFKFFVSIQNLGTLPTPRPLDSFSPPDRPTFRAFSFPTPIFFFFSLSGDLLVSFFLSPGVFSWNFGGVLVGLGPQMCLFSPSGCIVKPPAAFVSKKNHFGLLCPKKNHFVLPKKSHPGSGASMLPVNRGSHGAMIIFLGEQPESPRNLGCEGNELVRRLVQTRSARLRSAQDQPTRASASARQWTKEIASVPCDHRLCVTNKCVAAVNHPDIWRPLTSLWATPTKTRFQGLLSYRWHRIRWFHVTRWPRLHTQTGRPPSRRLCLTGFHPQWRIQ